MKPKPFPEVPTTTSRITLMRDGEYYRWRRDDGQWVSPIFTTLEAAHYASTRWPFLSDEEWQLYHRLPEEKIEIPVRKP